MLQYTIVFFILGLVAAVLGFGGTAADATGIAKGGFVVFELLTIAASVNGLARNR